MKKKGGDNMFLIIDGSSLLATHFYGSIPDGMKMAKTEEEKAKYYKDIMQNSKGVYTNAVFGALDAVLKIIKYQKPDHLLVVLDKTNDTFRRKIYPEYKATRNPKPEPFRQQVPLFMQALRYIGIPVLFSDDFEADDLAGSAIRKFEHEEKCVFMTKDHDYLQLIDKNVKGWMMQISKEKVDELEVKYFGDYEDREKPNIPRKVFEFTARQVRGEEGVTPLQIVDKKALCGDKSDNIPGVHGVGESAAIPLLNQYGSVEKIYEIIEKAQTPEAEKNLSLLWRKTLGVKKSPLNALKKGKDMCFLSKQLATIKTDCQVPEELQWYVPHIDFAKLENVRKTLELPALG